MSIRPSVLVKGATCVVSKYMNNGCELHRKCILYVSYTAFNPYYYDHLPQSTNIHRHTLIFRHRYFVWRLDRFRSGIDRCDIFIYSPTDDRRWDPIGGMTITGNKEGAAQRNSFCARGIFTPDSTMFRGTVILSALSRNYFTSNLNPFKGVTRTADRTNIRPSKRFE